MASLKPLVAVVVVAALLIGGAFLAYARWAQPIARADRALAAGELERALEQYAAAEARFDNMPQAKQAFGGEYARVLDNELWALYQLGRYDTVVERAAGMRPGVSSFWAGCALFQKAREEEEGQARLGLLGRAEEEFRKALQAQPQDWDTKFNYELTARLADELRKQPKAQPSRMMQLLRPQPKAGAPPARRVG